MRRAAPFVVGCLLLICGAMPAFALDRIHLVQGRAISGDVTGMTSLEVTLKQGSATKTVPVHDILFISYGGEPAQLSSVRSSVRNANYDNVLRQIARIDVSKLKRPEIQQDMDFYRALATAKIALRGGSDVREAGRTMLAFVSKNPDSYHRLSASEALGELLVAVGRYENAKEQFVQLERSPSTKTKMRAAVQIGRTLVVEKKYPEALESFDKAIRLAAEGDTSTDAERLSATLGRATCLAATGKYAEGIELVEEVVSKADTEDTDLHARAYVTLGNCYLQKPDSTKEALLAFLHVDVLYFNSPQAHAEALAHLKQLWTQVGKGERALQAARVLEERYANSPWAKGH